MNVLLLGCAYSGLQVEEFQSKSKRGYQYAAQNFQEALFDGFLANNAHISVLSIPSLSTYPMGSRIFYVADCPFTFKNEIIGTSFGFINLPIINHYPKSRIHRQIDRWYYNSIGEKCIIVYAMLKEQMHYAIEAKKRHPDIKLCLIIPDLPMYMNCNRYYKMLGMQKRSIKTINELLSGFDCFTALAEPMIDYLGIGNKPYTVVEGIYSEEGDTIEQIVKFSNKTIMYAGGIVSRYGVFDLIEAFHRLKDPDIRLLLCGPCPEMDKLNKYLIQDNRISYKGLLPTNQVRLLQKQVSLLVNPRHSTEEFTKYSFPSKTIEYMASGTPVLMSPLPSMPDEYKEYLYLFDDESIDGMKTKLEATLNIEPEILKEKGKSASEYILKNKNSKVQVSKIIELLKNV